VGDLLVCGQLAVVLEDEVAGGALHLGQAQALQVVRQLRHRQERRAAFTAFPALLPRGSQKVLNKDNPFKFCVIAGVKIKYTTINLIHLRHFLFLQQ
jgi:hypothetical protein